MEVFSFDQWLTSLKLKGHLLLENDTQPWKGPILCSKSAHFRLVYPISPILLIIGTE